MREEKREMIKHILKVLATTGIIIIAFQSPYFVNQLIKQFFRNPKWFVKDLAECFHYLKYEGYISVKRKRGKIEINLTRKGKKKINELNLWDLKIEKEKKWDGKWRIVLFDVPKKLDRVREAFRLKLRELGFYQFQKSVWLYPYKCKKEITYLRELLGAQNYIKIIITKKIELEDKIYKFFNLSI